MPAGAKPLFRLGRIAATPGAIAAMLDAGTNAAILLRRHVTGDWGDMDAGRIVIDEVYGQAVALLGLRHFLLSTGGGLSSIPYAYVLVGFVLFRVFDIFKPFPARTFDRQATGFSNVMDDVVAGLYAALILRALIRIWQS